MALLMSLVPPEPSSDDAQRISIAVRLPDSSVRKRFWLPTNTVEDLYNWVSGLHASYRSTVYTLFGLLCLAV